MTTRINQENRALIPGFLSGAVLMVLYLLPSGEFLQTKIARPIEFKLRSSLGKDPSLDPHLKIYSFSDATLQYLDGERMPLKQWSLVFESFKYAKPRALFIDKVFGYPDGIEERKAFEKSLKNLGFPVIMGSFVSKTRIVDRPLLSLENRADFDLSQWAEDPEDLGAIPMQTGYAYGPHPGILSSVKNVGHIVYENNFKVDSFFRLENNRAIPAASLLLSTKRHFKNGELILDGHVVPLDGDGKILINVARPSSYASKTFDLKNVLQAVSEGKVPPNIPNDGVIFILPSMYTGQTDIHQSPFGMMPGGHLMAALASSVLSGQWLTILPHGWLLVVLSSFFGTVFGFFTRRTLFWLGFVGGALSLFGVGQYLFSSFSLETPWLFYTAGFLVPALLVTFEKYRLSEAATRRIRAALEGSISRSQLDELLKRTSHSLLEPRGITVTIVFIDIVGFSKVAAKMTPRNIFSELKTLISDWALIITKHGGVVDKMTGDGMLCYFGFLSDKEGHVGNHVEEAVQCAIEIQKQNAVQDSKYRLRIGINTASVFIGNLGNDKRIELTLIGNGVNLAKRYETACEPTKILIGPSTKEVLGNLPGVDPVKKKIVIKHLSEPIEAYEIDPFADQQKMGKRLFLSDRRKA